MSEREPLKLTHENVELVFVDCLFRNEELPEGTLPKEGEFTKAKGVVMNVGFHKERLQSHKQDVVDMLNCLNSTFKQSAGGGWSFLQMCEDKDGNQWTGEHRQMDKLVCLGVALDLVSLTPTEMNAFLPGRMPYVTIKD